MRTKYLIFLIFILPFLNCSNGDSVDTESEITIARCFTVKENGTEIRIANARVILYTAVCGAGCGSVMLGNALTDSNGEVCFSLTESKNKDILQITCTSSGYNQFEINSPGLNFSEIFLDPN